MQGLDIHILVLVAVLPDQIMVLLCLALQVLAVLV
jgi:hypothetical protein